MSTAELARTVRRGVALLLVPPSLLLVQLPAVTDNLAGDVESSLPGLSGALGTVLLGVAVAYLIVSVLRQIHAAADLPF